MVIEYVRDQELINALMDCWINGLNLLMYCQGNCVLASQYGFCTGGQTFAGFPG